MKKFPKSLVFDVTNLDGSVTTYSYEWSYSAAEHSTELYRNLFVCGEIAGVKASLVW